MTDAEVARLPNGIREQVVQYRLLWHQRRVDTEEERLHTLGMVICRLPYQPPLDVDYSRQLQRLQRHGIAALDPDSQAMAIAVRRLYLSEREIRLERFWFQGGGLMLIDEAEGTGPWREQRDDIQRQLQVGDVVGGPLLMPQMDLDANNRGNYFMQPIDRDLDMMDADEEGGGWEDEWEDEEGQSSEFEIASYSEVQSLVMENALLDLQDRDPLTLRSRFQSGPSVGRENGQPVGSQRRLAQVGSSRPPRTPPRGLQRPMRPSSTTPPDTRRPSPRTPPPVPRNRNSRQRSPPTTPPNTTSAQLETVLRQLRAS